MNKNIVDFIAALQQAEKSGKKFWDIKASAADEKVGEAFIYGDIVSYKWYSEDITAADFAKDLKTLGDDIETLNIYINSYGGSVFQGQAIYSQLNRYKADKNVYIDGIAASAASFIAMAGDKIYMPENAMMMIHNPWSFAFGEASDMRKEAEVLDKIREAMLPCYLNHAGDKLTEAKLIELLDAETWLTAKDAFDIGLCDVVLEAKEIAAYAGSKEILANYKNVPDALKALKPDGADDKSDVGDSGAVGGVGNGSSSKDGGASSGADNAKDTNDGSKDSGIGDNDEARKQEARKIEDGIKFRDYYLETIYQE